MRHTTILALLLAAAAPGCADGAPANPTPGADFSAVSRVDSGRAVSVMLTAYSTTLRADGQDRTSLRVAVADSVGREIMSADDSIRIYVEGDGRITAPDGSALPAATDSAGASYAPLELVDGLAYAELVAGTTPDHVEVEARSGTLFPGGHQIHTYPAGEETMVPTAKRLAPGAQRFIPRMIGADISFLPQIESEAGYGRGPRAFFEDGKQVDPIQLLREHGFNTIRLRLFVHPENPGGYAPGQGFCGLDSTLVMAHRVKDAGMDFLLDLHYSDYWADPQQQNKPAAWADLDYPTLVDTMRSYTASVLRTMKAQGVLPDMVQIGNEINHGLLWPDGDVSHLDQMAGLLKAGVAGVRDVAPDMPVMMHLALGGQNREAHWWLDNMLARGLTFDVLGLSYYPRWHGTLEDLYSNVHDLADRYHKPIVVVEYSDFKREVADIVFGLPHDLGKGTAIWEPLNARSGLFDREGNVTPLIQVYDSLAAEYLGRSPGG